MKKTSSKALRIVDRITGDDAQLRRLIQDEHQNLDVPRQIADLRTSAALSQRDLAATVGTTQSVISRLEDADYDGHSLTMLRRIAEVFELHVEVRFVSHRSRRDPSRRDALVRLRARGRARAENFQAMGGCNT